MERGHLTDNELQECADLGVEHFDSTLRVHVAACGRCRNRIDQYIGLIGALEEDTVPELPGDLAVSVVSRLGLQRRDSFIERYMAELVGALGFIAAVLALLWVTEPLEIATAAWQATYSLTSLTLPGVSVVSRIGEHAREVTLLVFGISTVFAMWMVDRIFRGRNRTRRSLFLA